MKSKVETREPVTYASLYPQRCEATGKITAAVAGILEPRGGFFVGPAGKHLLPTPRIPQDKKGDECKPDSPEMKAWRAEVHRIGEEERRLTAIAESAKSLMPHLEKWSEFIRSWEEGLEIASQSGTLADADLEDMGMIRREHERFLRACQSWLDRLAH